MINHPFATIVVLESIAQGILTNNLIMTVLWLYLHMLCESLMHLQRILSGLAHLWLKCHPLVGDHHPYTIIAVLESIA